MALAGSLKTFLKVPLGCSSKVSLRFCKGFLRRLTWGPGFGFQVCRRRLCAESSGSADYAVSTSYSREAPFGISGSE